MPLTAGERLGPYEILAPLGAGGMGEVYRARDAKLKRDVAIKILPPAFAVDAGRMARFQREAELLASLNHPNIAHVYGIEERALVMELVEGESPHGPMPFEDAWRIALQMAEALEYAHDNGIVHRDLKPANVKVTPEGVVKLLDFGLAKALSEPKEDTPIDSDISPTVTLSATVAGCVMGTAAYIAPEQAKGKRVDKRADIWSWGVVLYELLTGERMFKGDDAADTLAQILTRQPDLDKVPPKVRRLLQRCLEKDPKRRLRDIGEAQFLIDEETSGAKVSPSQSWAGRFAWLAAGAFALIAFAFGAAYWRAAQRQERPLIRFSADMGPDSVAGARTTAVLSLDGTRIVFPMRVNGILRLATRTLNQAQAAPLTGTEGGSDPFFSPDGQWLGFFSDGKLKKVALQGGAPVTLCDASGSSSWGARGGSWGEDGNIVFTPGIASSLMHIPSAGGKPQLLTKLALTEVSHRWPQVLPGGKAVLFTAGTNPFSWDNAYIAAVSLSTGEIKIVQRGGYFGRYMASAHQSGHLMYLHESTLFAVPFDPGRLEVMGTPVPVLEDVAGNVAEGTGQFDWSMAGSFVYLSGKAATGSSYPIVWMDSSGKTTPLMPKPGPYGAPRFSPNGKRLAFTAPGGAGIDVWVYDWERDVPTQLTFSGPGNLEMAWTPDSKHIVFGSNAGATAALWWMRSDGSGEPQKLLEHKNTGVGLRPQSFTPDAGRLVFDNNAATQAGVEIWILPLDLSDPDHPKPGKPEPFLTGPEREVDAALSPDGKWMAYSSNESGIDEIFVRPLPGPGGKWRISTGGGKYPMWSRKVQELFYLSLIDDRIMVSNYTVQGDSFSARKPHVWADHQVLQPNFIRVLDLHPGQALFETPIAGVERIGVKSDREHGNRELT